MGFFEADVEADELAAVVAVGAAERFVGHDEAGDAAPAVADFEELQGARRISRCARAPTSSLKTIEKTLAEPVKSRFQMSWPGQSGRAGWRTSVISGRCFEPLGDRERRLFEVLEADAEGLEAAEGEAAVVGRDGEAEQAVDVADLPHGGFVVVRRRCRAAGRCGRRRIW